MDLNLDMLSDRIINLLSHPPKNWYSAVFKLWYEKNIGNIVTFQLLLGNIYYIKTSDFLAFHALPVTKCTRKKKKQKIWWL